MCAEMRQTIFFYSALSVQRRMQEFWNGWGHTPHVNAVGTEKMKSFLCQRCTRNENQSAK